MADIRTADKFWVIKTTSKNKTDNLAYMSIIDKDHPKRAPTGCMWAGINSYDKNWEEHGEVFDNVPTSGIEFVSYHGRYSTDNKVMRVQDPRGFQVEIYIDNLMDIIKNVTIKNGVIEDGLTWGRRSGKIYLMHPKNEGIVASEYTETKKLDIGDHFKTPNDEFIYLGKKKIKMKADIYDVDLSEKIQNDRSQVHFSIDEIKNNHKLIKSKQSTVTKHLSAYADDRKQWSRGKVSFTESNRVIVKDKNVKLPKYNLNSTDVMSDIRSVVIKVTRDVIKDLNINPHYSRIMSYADENENDEISFFYSSSYQWYNNGASDVKRVAIIYSFEVMD